MNTRAEVDAFLAKKKLAIAGVSRSGNKFGNIAAKELGEKGYEIFPINPEADEIKGEKCYRRVSAIETAPDGVIIATPAEKTKEVVQDCLDAGIRDIWIQQGADSEEGIKLAQQGGGSVVSGECILMYAEPAAFHHKLHRWIWGLLGKLPN